MAAKTRDSSGRKICGNTDKRVASDRGNPGRNVNNISEQTGEEFSKEFLNDRGALRGVPDPNQRIIVGSNNSHNQRIVYEDPARIQEPRRKESYVDVFDSRPGRNGEVESRAYPDNISRNYGEQGSCRQKSGKCPDEVSMNSCTQGSSIPSSRLEESPQPLNPYGMGSSEDSFHGKMKIMCSFGGTVLPRPNDAKLRYVGGETRIISVRKNVTWNELLKKTLGICKHPHTVRYQLPGEDLDALISVFSDEDLNHMIEEYEELERDGCPNRLRIFLIPTGESDNPSCLDERIPNPLHSAGADPKPIQTNYQYAVSMNGLDNSPRRSSSGHSLTSLTTQLGTSDYGRSIRDSPTFHTFDNKEYSPTSQDCGGRFPNHSTNFYTATYFPDGNESINTLTTDRIQFENACHPNASSSYMNTPQQPGPLPNYAHHHQRYFLDPDVTNNPFEVRLPNRVPSGDFQHYQVHAESHMSSLMHSGKERAFSDSRLLEHCEGSKCRIEDGATPMSSWNNGREKSPLLAVPHSSQERTMQWRGTVDENYRATKYENQWNSGREKSPSLEMSNSSQGSQVQWQGSGEERHHSGKYENQWNSGRERSPSVPMSRLSQERTMKWQGTVDEKHPATKYENQRNFRTPPHSDLNQDVEKWIKTSLNQSDEERKHWETKVELAPTSYDAERKNTNNMKYTVSIPPQPLASQKFGHVDYANPVNAHENLRRQHPYGHELPTDARELYIKTENITKDQKSSTNQRTSNQKDFHGFPAHGRSPSPESRNQELELLTAKNADSSRVVHVHHEHTANHPVSTPATESVHKHQTIKEQNSSVHVQQSVRVQCSDDRRGNEVHESVVIVEDVTGTTHEDIPTSSKIVPLVEEDTDEFQIRRDTCAESVDDESDFDFDDLQADSKEIDECISDATMAEIEAGIYGLQIIKNSDVEEVTELGAGTFGTVYFGKWRGTDVAIKRIKKSCFSTRPSEQEQLIKDFWREARILSNLHHPNVLAFYGVVPDGPGGTMATLTEYMVNGSLRRVLQKKEKSLDRRKKLMVALDAAFGMEYLHLRNIIHFDLKCDNLLVNLRDPQRPICKVGDFGLSRIKQNTLVSGGVRGTLPWMAPELLDGSSNRVSEKVDVYSFGVAMWEILTGEEPFGKMHCGAIIGGIVNNTLRPPIPENCDPEWKRLMEECWGFDPKARPSFTEITHRLRSMSAAFQPKRHNPSTR